MTHNDSELFERIAGFFKNIDILAEKTELDGQEALVIPFDTGSDDMPADCTITVIHPDEEYTVVQLLFSLFTDLDRKVSKDAVSLLPRMNLYLTLGSFGAIEDEGFLYLSYAFVTDGLKTDNILMSLGAAFSVLTLTADKGRELLLPLVEGKMTKEEMMSTELNIVQE